MSFARGLLHATTRNVKDAVQPILFDEFSRGKKAARLSHTAYWRKARRRVIDKYGMDSEQHRMLSLRTPRVGERDLLREALARNWAPSWETIMRLEQDEPEDSIWAPGKLRLRRLQRANPRPRPHPMSVAGQPWPSKHGVRRTLIRDATPGEEPVGTETESRPVQTHKSGRPAAKKPNPLFRSILPEPAWRKPSEGVTKSRTKRDQPPTEKALFKSIFSDAAWREPSEGITGITKSRAKRDQPRASQPQPSNSQKKGTPSQNHNPDEADIKSSLKGHSGTPSRTPGASQPRDPTYRAKRLISALDPAPETAAASSKAKTREGYKRTPRSRRGKVSIVQHLDWS